MWESECSDGGKKLGQISTQHMQLHRCVVTHLRWCASVGSEGLRTLMLLRLTSVKEPSLFFILCRVSSTFVGLGGSSNTGFIFSPLITSTPKHTQKSGCHVQISRGTFRSFYVDLLLKPSLTEVPSYVWLLVTRVWTPRMAANRNAAQSEVWAVGNGGILRFRVVSFHSYLRGHTAPYLWHWTMLPLALDQGL